MPHHTPPAPTHCTENVCAPLVVYVMIPVEVVLGRVEKYHAPLLEYGLAVQFGVPVKAFENVCAVVVVPDALDTVPTWTFAIGTPLIS